jgi:hypothetical protein
MGITVDVKLVMGAGASSLEYDGARMLLFIHIPAGEAAALS